MISSLIALRIREATERVGNLLFDNMAASLSDMLRNVLLSIYDTPWAHFLLQVVKWEELLDTGDASLIAQRRHQVAGQLRIVEVHARSLAPTMEVRSLSYYYVLY